MSTGKRTTAAGIVALVDSCCPVLWSEQLLPSEDVCPVLQPAPPMLTAGSAARDWVQGVVHRLCTRVSGKALMAACGLQRGSSSGDEFVGDVMPCGVERMAWEAAVDADMAAFQARSFMGRLLTQHYAI